MDALHRALKAAEFTEADAWGSQTLETRGYPIEETNRDTLIALLTQMHAPGAGVWLARSTPAPR